MAERAAVERIDALESWLKPSLRPPGTVAKRMKIRSTTILAVRRDGQLAIAGDGQVTLG